ncbi:MAG: Uma2 family endonuclease [Bacteroidetes bacterium]|nr:MAG: Uma2 family endonuclease [Bacteroidota bacterium]
MPIPAEHEKFTYKDYLNWPENERWELIYGEAWDMSPAPTRKHQKIVGKLFFQIENYLKDKDYDVYIAPFDVRLPENEEDNDKEAETVVQPDLLVVCDKSKLDDAGCKGSPDWIIEILSPSTAVKDLNNKYNLYEEKGVKEYWIIDPSNNYLTVYLLDISGKYFRSGVYGLESKVKSTTLPDLTIDLNPVFSDN